MSTAFSSKVSFKTEQLTAGESVKRWREYVADVYCRQDVRLLSADRLHGEIEKRIVADAIVSRFKSGGEQRLSRTRELAKLDGIEHLQFVFPMAGRFFYQQGSREEYAAAGDAFILNASREFRIDFSADAESIVLAFPGDLIRKRIVGIDDFAMRSTLSDPLLVRMISGISSNLIDIESEADAKRIQNVCIGLLEAAVAQARGRRPSWESESTGLLIERIRGVIGENCSDYTFGVTHLAAWIGMSTRKVQKILSDHDSTFSRELLEARLAKAAHLLKTRPTVSIGQIAERCGFVSQSHFSSSYRKRFGTAPRADRQSG